MKGAERVDLSWNGASSTRVDIYRNGSVVKSTANDGAETDTINQKGRGTYAYKVCEAGTATCSGVVSVVF